MEGLVQVGPYSFLDEGVDRVVHVIRDEARLAGVALFTYSWSKATAHRSSRPVDGHPEGRQDDFQGGLYVQPHAEYYKDTSIDPERMRTKDACFEGRDILREVLRPCQEAGLKVYGTLWLGSEPGHIRELEPAFAACSEVDAWGQPVGQAMAHQWQLRPFVQHCFNNPDYRAFHRGMVEDQLRSYPLDGLLFLPHERYGPIESVLISGTVPTCFCSHCLAKGKTRGIDVEAAQAGFRELHAFATQARSDTYKPSPDGHVTTLLRLILRYPEILAWEKLWYESIEAYLKELYTAAKAAKPDAKIGVHVWQAASWALVHRAETHYNRVAEAADWIKPVVYDKPAGVRFLSTYARPCQRTILRGLGFEEMVRFLLGIIGQEPPATADALAQTGFGPSYVERETARIATAAQGRAEVYPGLGIDVEPAPGSGMEYPEQSPQDIEASIRAAHRGGARGLVLSVSYAQMRLQSLRAVGRALSSIS
ncbi:MAG: hypothetical protein HYX92_01025 [Chloroflexi bacterium]|nr:hypothetical protein [Chloroflexota bacterium]